MSSLLDETFDFDELVSDENVSERCKEQILALRNYNNAGNMPLPLVILLAIPATCIILLTIFGNLLVLCFKARVGRTNTTLLVWNLGLTDFLVGVLVLPFGAIHLIAGKWNFGRFLCRVWVAADVTFCTCSVVTICIISVDRYLAVTRPLKYKSVVTKAKVITVMFVIWLFSSSILLTTVRWDQPPCYDDTICFAGNEIRYLAHSVVFAFFLPASVTLTLYWRIYQLARNRQRALDRGFLMILGHNMNFLTNTISQHTTLRVHFGRNNGMVEHQRRVLRTHERIAKTLGVVSCSFLFCWLPFFSLYLTNYKCRGCIPTIAIDIASWLGYCNSMLNPIIYSFTVREFKRSAIRLILPLWRLLHRCCPFCPVPPEHVASRMSRNGHRHRNKSRPRSFELGANRSGVITSRVSNRRRQTEPAVFSLVKPMQHPQEIIIEEDEDVIHEYTETNGTLTASRLSSMRHNGRITPRRASNERNTLSYRDHSTRNGTMIAVIGRSGSNAGQPLLPIADRPSSPCSVRVFCETHEADV